MTQMIRMGDDVEIDDIDVTMCEEYETWQRTLPSYVEMDEREQWEREHDIIRFVI